MLNQLLKGVPMPIFAVGIVMVGYMFSRLIGWLRAPSPAETITGITRRLKYRCQDARTDYVFDFAQQSEGTWRIYIVNTPSYGVRDEGLHATHRLTDNGRHYICWTDPLPSEEQAQTVAKLWAEATQKYIHSGTRF